MSKQKDTKIIAGRGVIRMQKIKVKLFINIDLGDVIFPKGRLLVSSSDMQVVGYPLVGTHEVEVPIPEFDIVEIESNWLRKQAASIELKSSGEINNLLEKAKKLEGK